MSRFTVFIISKITDLTACRKSNTKGHLGRMTLPALSNLGRRCWVSGQAICPALNMFSIPQPSTLIIKMKSNYNIATKDKTDKEKFPVSQTLCSSLKGPCQRLVDPATALV